MDPASVRPSSSVCSHFQVFSSETAWQIKAKSYVEPPWEGGMKVYTNGLGHMTAMPIYGKNLKNLLLYNQKSFDLKTWHEAAAGHKTKIAAMPIYGKNL